jgi:hypothetical protein
LVAKNWGVGYGEKGLFFRPLFFAPFLPGSDGELIFCQKKFLLVEAWFCQNKTTKFDLLTLMNN